MLHWLLATLSLLVATIPQSAPPAAETERPRLSVGDKAPPLTVGAWAKGDPLKSLEPGRVYLVDFWATWCVPCVQQIPHLTEVQRRHADQGLTVVGVSSTDAKGIEDVAPFVEMMGEKMGYTVAVDRDRATHDAWMTAAGQISIPMAFLVDREGLIAWMGNPGYPQKDFERTLESVLAGTFDTRGAAEKAKRVEALFRQASEAWREERHDEALGLLDQIVGIDPPRHSAVAMLKFNSLLTQLGDSERAYAYAAVLVDTTYLNDPDTLATIARAILDRPDASPRGCEIALRAASRSNELSGNMVSKTLDLLAAAQFQAGDVESAVATQTRALASASESDQLTFYQRLERYRLRLQK
ncbi:MAG: redoxin family protein [Phycisphaeraceae bacterium]|nr:redoxin family protein [Phycisphaeraceae bacterium]